MARAKSGHARKTVGTTTILSPLFREARREWARREERIRLIRDLSEKITEQKEEIKRMHARLFELIREFKKNKAELELILQDDE